MYYIIFGVYVSHSVYHSTRCDVVLFIYCTLSDFLFPHDTIKSKRYRWYNAYIAPYDWPVDDGVRNLYDPHHKCINDVMTDCDYHGIIINKYIWIFDCMTYNNKCIFLNILNSIFTQIRTCHPKSWLFINGFMAKNAF